MHQTPWTKKQSSFPSDRLKPSYPPSQPQPPSSKQKGKSKTPDVPKSPAARALDSLLASLQSSKDGQVDPNGGCFCLARNHPLSPYTPICASSCGLVLCSLNLPSYACPSCKSSLLPSPSSKSTLIARIQSELDALLAREEQAREQEREDARKLAGAFPSLNNSSTSINNDTSSGLRSTANQTHKVLSLNAKTKKATVKTYSPSPPPSKPVSRVPSQSELAHRAKQEEDERRRVPRPPDIVPPTAPAAGKENVWKNLLLDEPVMYVPPPKKPQNEGSGEQKSKRRRKKGKGGDGGAGEPGPSTTT